MQKEKRNNSIIKINVALIDSQLFSATEKILLMMLLSDNKISITVLSKRMGISVQAICRTLNSLEEKSAISRIKRKAESGGNMVNEYIVYDYPEVWNAKTVEDLKKAVEKIQGKVNDK